MVKYTLPGPMTMVDTLYDGHYRSREKLAWAFAEILNEEARAIAATGVDVIQFDEPAFNVYFDEVRDWGVAALERAAQGVPCTTAVHICYGYGIKANNDWKKTLGSQWRQYEQTFPLLAGSAIDQVSLECANSHVPIELIGLLAGKDVLVGAIDVAIGPGRDAGGRRRDDPGGAALRAGRAAVPVHQLRHGAAGARRGPRQAAGAGRRGGAGARRARGDLSRSTGPSLRPEPSHFPLVQWGIPKRFRLAYAPKGVLFQVLEHVLARSCSFAADPYFSVLENETWGGHPPADYLS